MEVKSFSIIQEGIDFKSNLLAISHAVVTLELIFFIDSFDVQNCSGTSVNVGLACCASISLFVRGNFVRHVEYKGGSSSLALKHNTVLESNQTILAESVRNILQTLSKLLLCVVDDKLAGFLLSHVLLESIA